MNELSFSSDAMRSAVQRLYDAAPEREWERMDRHRTEFAVTRRALAEYLPPPPARVLDCGGGPGRYAIELARQGYQVVLFDLSDGNLALARQKAAEAGVALACEQGTALDLGRFADDAFDAVLLMGPLYHLLEVDERRRALREAYRVLKPGGPLFAAFITRYAAHHRCAAQFPDQYDADAAVYESLLIDGRVPPPDDGHTTFVGYFAHPTEVEPLCRSAGFEVATVRGVEGLVSAAEVEINKLSGPAWDTWVGVNWRIAADPCTHGGVEHLLAVAHKPGWRSVLQRIARCLADEGVHYVVVGGTSLALHGLPLKVKDLDLELDEAGVYRFAELFSDHTVEAVSLREGQVYRSHFGRFEFDGVSVEVMACLERREGDAWAPTQTSYSEAAELDGVPVVVSWLEEETLAYIRRGRLDRAALCLPHCDHGRLLALLRGTRPTQVL
jgi:ubiquinone/menaquinone biosynthesis C-methylase UbiE